MKRLLVLPLIISILSICAAVKGYSTHSPRFHSGIVVLHSGDTIHCKLNFTRKVSEGLLQIVRENHIEVLTVKDVHSFSYIDEIQKQQRTFYNINFTPDLSTRSHEVFVELLHSTNTISILNHRTLGYSDKSIQFNPFRKKVVVNYYYLLEQKSGLILPLSKENVLLMMEERKNQIVPFIETNGLKLKAVSDFVTLLDYHQTLR
jgi:hypothetical protein